MQSRFRDKLRMNFGAALALIALASSPSWDRPALGAGGPLEGAWKLVVLAYGADEFAIVKVLENDGKKTATVVDAQSILGANKVTRVISQGEMITLILAGPDGETSFKGRLASDGVSAGKVLGSVKFRSGLYPARLERTDASKVAPMSQGTVMATLAEARQTKIPRRRSKSSKSNHRQSTAINGTRVIRFSIPNY